MLNLDYFNSLSYDFNLRALDTKDLFFISFDEPHLVPMPEVTYNDIVLCTNADVPYYVGAHHNYQKRKGLR